MMHNSDSITWVMEGKITDLKKFKEHMDTLVVEVKKDPGSLVYYWMVSEDGTQFSIYQRFVDQTAAIQHLDATFQHTHMLVDSAAIERLHVYNHIDQPLRDKLAPHNPVILEFFGGFMNMK